MGFSRAKPLNAKKWRERFGKIIGGSGDMYQVLYRKWRPKVFDDVAGQPQVTVTLKNELKSRGYLINDSSLRTYITNVCKVDNKDSTHFCLKELCDNFPKFNWRKKNQKDL